MIVVDFVINFLSTILLFAGVFLGISGAVGLFRFPDFFTRMHAASIIDTLCAACIIGGLVLQAGFTLVAVKLIFLFLFIWYTSPAAGHALVRAANKTGLQPLLRQDAQVKTAKEKNIQSKVTESKNTEQDSSKQEENKS